MASYEDGPQLDALRIGQVVGVRGRTVFVQVDATKHSAHIQFLGTMVPSVAVGTLLRIDRGFELLIGQVEGEDVADNRDPGLIDQPAQGRQLKRVLTIALLGRLGDGGFEGGIAQVPMIGNPAFLLTAKEIDEVDRTAAVDEDIVRIGVQLADPTRPVFLSVDKTMASHIGVFGNTGSGKSNTLTTLLSGVFRKFQGSSAFRDRARFVLFDFSGEYLDTLDGGRTPLTGDPLLKRQFRLGNPGVDIESRLKLPLATLEDVEFWTVVLEATPKTQAPFLRRALANLGWLEALDSETSFKTALSDLLKEMLLDPSSSVDASSPTALIEGLETVFDDIVDYRAFADAIQFFRDKVVFNATLRTFYLLEPGGGQTYSSSPEFVRQLGNVVDDLIVPAQQLPPARQVQMRVLLQFHRDVARGYANREFLNPLIKRLETRLPDLDLLLEFADETSFDHVLTVIGLSELLPEMQRMIAVLTTKWLYALHQELDPDDRPFLAFVIDEAHHVLSPTANAESEQWRDYRLGVFESIAKEGRKHGAFLHISTQRPSDISPTIVSQLHNFFVHRLVNGQDIRAVERLVPYLDAVSFEQIPILATGVCIIAGQSLQRPIVVRVAPAPAQVTPRSETPRPSATWS